MTSIKEEELKKEKSHLLCEKKDELKIICSELRTLNDLQEITISQKILKMQLKEEAIKWYHRSDGNKHTFIKKFFNITDEEMKEKK